MADILQVRAFALSAKDAATAASTTLTAVLKGVRNGVYSSDVANGKTMISTSEAGGSVTFAVGGSISPEKIMALAQEALDWCAGYTDPDNPPATMRRIKRMRASFSKASL